ncbi:MAG: DUF2911 domain-containing protein [Gemmatimonadetes bacterium]|nr:DUF2911 domain-containing protein [Gemmatimonadota bacterium]
MNQPTRASGSSRFVLPLAISLAAASGLAAQAAPDSGVFVVRLGADTTAVERYVRTAERLHAVAVTRSPRTMVRELTLTFGPDGRVRRYEIAVRDPAAAPGAPPTQTSVMTFEGDSITVVTTERGSTRTRRMAAGRPDVIPRTLTFFSLQETALVRALESGRTTIYMLEDEPVSIALRRMGRDSVALETPDLGRWLARVDARGRIVGMKAGDLGTTVERAGWLDIEAVARQYADRDARGMGLGTLSPRDTVVASVQRAKLTVDYGRPARRGRVIFGGLVPWNRVWRTGANQATHFSTDQPLAVGGATIPAGTYTLYTIPAPEGWTLIINRQTGQAGTEYDEKQDLARLSMQIRTLDDPVERLTIVIEESQEGGVLKLRWDRTEAWVPFIVVRGTPRER